MAAKSGDAAPVGVDRVDGTAGATIQWIIASLSGSIWGPFGGWKWIDTCRWMMLDCQMKGYMLV